MQLDERAIVIPCGAAGLVGILSIPARPARRGVVIVVGGPQVRTGSHRQFTLLARALAAAGTPVLRFDHRGMGDSDGAAPGFDRIEDDLRAAIDCFQQQLPDLQEIVLWGLCDGAAASVLYAPRDARVRGLVLLNPWVRTGEGEARATLKHYYGKRLRSGAVWGRILRGGIDLRAAIRSMLTLALRALRPAPADADALPARLHAALMRFDGRVLVLLAGADLTAQEFGDLAATPSWSRLLGGPRFALNTLDGADHTFSRRAWHDQLTAWTIDWVGAW
jgi:exosortase A-associated hydrolase 1